MGWLFFKFEHKHTYITNHLTSQHYVVYHPLQIVILVSLVLLEIITAAWWTQHILEVTHWHSPHTWLGSVGTHRSCLSCVVFLHQRGHTWQFLLLLLRGLLCPLRCKEGLRVGRGVGVANLLITVVNRLGHLRKPIVFFVVIDEKCGRLILLPSLCFAAIAFLPEWKIQIIAVKADPVSLPGLVGAVGGPGHRQGHLFDRSEICFHQIFKLSI